MYFVLVQLSWDAPRRRSIPLVLRGPSATFSFRGGGGGLRHRLRRSGAPCTLVVGVGCAGCSSPGLGLAGRGVMGRVVCRPPSGTHDYTGKVHGAVQVPHSQWSSH